jgi:hypothetical protein
MHVRFLSTKWRPVAGALVACLILAAPAWGQQRPSTSSAKDQPKNTEPVVRTYGAEGGFRTEVTSRTMGTLNEEDRRQASLLMIQVFKHIDKASNEIDADSTKDAVKDVKISREAIKAVRTMLPKTTIRTKTLAPDGKTIFEDEDELQESRVPLYEGMLHAETLAPILAARRDAMEIAGYHVVESETITTETIADLDPIEAQLARAAKALDDNKPEVASKALALALIRGVDVRFSKEDSELAAARDAIWLARRALEENNATQAVVNLADARRRLKVYRELLSQDQRQEVDQMIREVEQLEGQLRQETTRPIGRGERARQGSTVTHWWDQVNSWFRRHF